MLILHDTLLVMPVNHHSLPTAQEAPVLYQKPEELPVIKELKDFMIAANYANISELLQFSGYELLAKEGFTHRALMSMMDVLQKNGLLYLFREN